MTHSLREQATPADRQREPAAGSRVGLPEARFVAAVVVVAVATLALASWQAPPAQALLLVLALAVPITGYTAMARAALGGFGAGALALGIGATLALWSALDFALIGLLNTTAPRAQAIVLTVLVAPVLWRLRSLHPGLLVPSRDEVRAVTRAAPAVLVVAAGIVGGAFVLRFAQDVARPQLAPTTAFSYFWLGMAIVFVPLVVVTLFVRGVAAPVRLVLIGVASYTWAFVRSPFQIFNYDEFGHLAETREIVFSSHLFRPDSVVPIGPKYPGFETLVVGLARLTGLPDVATGQLCILLFHVATVCGVATLGALVFPGNTRAAVLAGLVYAVSPQFVAFDSIYSYESFALPLFVLVLMSALAAAAHDAGRTRRRWVGVGVSLTLVLLITHHLTPLLLTVALLLAAATHGVAAWRRRRAGAPDAGPMGRRAGGLALSGVGVLAGVVLWALVVGADLPAYLGAFPRSALDAIESLLGSGKSVNIDSATSFAQQQGSTRALFQGTQLPAYERYVGIVAQVLSLAGCAVVVWRRRRSSSPAFAAFVLLAIGYFASLPLALVSVASSGAHRSWAFTFMGVAVLLAGLADRGGRPADDPRGAVTARRGAVAAAILVPVILMGSFATSVNLYSRFPGPYVLGADGRDDTTDVKDAAEWLLHTAGPDQQILGIRRTAAVFSSIATANQVDFPGWLIFFPTTDPAPNTIDALRAAGARYLIVDSRISTEVSNQSYFKPSEPAPPAEPLPKASVTKFAHASWLREVHRSGHITIYRIVAS